jgi:exopolysaccharide biosynthesis polyprenyl glycosylphosphotransferase
MLSQRIQGLNNLYYCGLAGVMTAGFWVYLLCLAGTLDPPGGYNYHQYVIYNLAGLAALAMAAFWSGSQDGRILRRDIGSNHRAALVHASSVGGGILMVLAATKDLTISRLFLFSFLPLLYVAFFFFHRFVPGLLLRRFFRHPPYVQRALLVGPLGRVERLTEWRAQVASLGVEFTCFFDNTDLMAQDIESTLDFMERVARRQRIAAVVVLGWPERREFIQALTGLCNRLGLRLLVVDGLRDFFERPVTYFSLCGLDGIDVMKEPLENPFNRLCKRALDLAVTLPVVVLVLPPLALVVWIAQRLQSPGPLFYRQTRAGRDNRPFRIYKFRTMHASRQAQGRQTTRGDARVFGFGRLLRRSSLDEIPQFLNVLRGEMSVVGPRPHMIIHNRRFCRAMESYHVRAFAKPGITGAAQVHGCRGEAKRDADIALRVRFDLDYIQHWSLRRDLAIILQTARQVLFPPKTAY